MTSDDRNRSQRSIVCGLDGSDAAVVALRVAARLARELRVRLVVVHVVQPQAGATGFGPTARQLAALPLDDLLAGGEALIDRMLDEEQVADAERRVAFGFAADRLADLADDEGAEFIVVGSRGRRAFKAALLGSVSADLIGVARCPVLVVPPGTGSQSQTGSTVAMSVLGSRGSR
jgi:nucleotide-binding universal stress UspA family protein